MITYNREEWDLFSREFQQVWVSEHRSEAQGPDSQAEINPDIYQFNDTIIYTARDNGTLVGYIVGIILCDTPFLNESTVHVGFYFIKPDYRGQGIGRKLFGLLEQTARDIIEQPDYIYCAVKTHLPFEGFLRHIGYEDCEIILRRKI